MLTHSWIAFPSILVGLMNIIIPLYITSNISDCSDGKKCNQLDICLNLLIFMGSALLFFSLWYEVCVFNCRQYSPFQKGIISPIFIGLFFSVIWIIIIILYIAIIVLLKDSQDIIKDRKGVNTIQIVGIVLSIFGFLISIFLFGISYYKEYKSNFHKREASRLKLIERKHKLQMKKKSQISANKRIIEKFKCQKVIQSAMEDNCPPSAKNLPKHTRSKIISCNNEFDDLERECYDSIQEYEGKLSKDIKTKHEISEAVHQRRLKNIQDATPSPSPYLTPSPPTPPPTPISEPPSTP